MPGIIGIHQFRYPKDDNKWRPNTRQDIFKQPRYYLWKPHLPPVYTNPKSQLVPAAMAINYNRYGLPPMPSVLHHPNYMFPMPTAKVHNYPYRKMNDLGTQSKPGNFHHITIINAIIPKPYIPLPTMAFQPAKQALRSHRNNKQIFYYHMNTGRPTVNTSRNRTSPQQQRPLSQHAHSSESMPSSVQPSTGHHPANTLYTTSGHKALQKTNNAEVGVGSFQCGQKTSGSYSQLDTNAANYYCNALNFYDNETNNRETQQQKVLPTPLMVTTTATSEKSLRADLNGYTSPTPIFLPTIYEPRVNFSAETTTKHSNKATDTILRTTTTAPSLTRSDIHEHSFFTIEDAITSAPPRNYIFNNPYEALSHARKRKALHSKHQLPIDSDVGTEKNSVFRNFFDDNTDTTSDMLDFNKSRLYSPAPYSSQRNEEMHTLRDSSPFSDLYGHSRNADGRWHHLNTTPFGDVGSHKSTTTARPIFYTHFSGITTTTSDISKTTPATISTTEHEEIKTEKTVIASTSAMPIVTTVANLSTTIRTKVKLARLKHPFNGRSTPTYKSQKNTNGLLAGLKNSSSPSTTPATSKKKSHKYLRQYKPKKGKLFKSLLHTTSTPSAPAQSTPSSTIATTTKAHNTNKAAYRTVTSSSTTEPSANNEIKTHSERLARDSKRLKGSKRNGKGRNATTPIPRSSKSRRRRVYTSSTTAKPHPLSSLNVTPASTAPTTLPSYTATTTKSTTRKSSSESKAKLHNLKTTTRMAPNEFNDYSIAGSKQSSRTVKPPSTRDGGGIPPLPIEIYFKNSQNTHI